MGTVISPWSASVCQGILDCCVKLLSVHPDVIMNAATVDAPANVAVKWGGLVSSVPSATGILAACTAPATSPGSASVSPDGEACFVMKNSTIVKRTQILARTAENVFP